MLVRRVAWRLAGRVTDRGLPAAAARAYYREVAASLARALDRLAGVRAVYAWGTFATGDERPGHSDVDLVAVIDDVPPADEVRLLQAIRARYARRQAVLPIDLTVLSAGELAPDAPLHELIRLRVADERPGLALAQWRLLAGEELRPGGAARPPAHLRYISDGRLQAAIAALAMGRESEARALLARFAENGQALPGDPAHALHAALALVDEHRARHAVPVERRPLEASGWRVAAPAPAALHAARALARDLKTPGLRSLTVYQPPFAAHPSLLLEGADVDAARPALRWAADGGAARAARAGLRVEVLTSRLAEDAWRSRALRWVGLTAAAEHLEGDPLAPRIGLPAGGLERDVARYGAVTAVACARWAAVGRRGFTRDDTAPLRVAALRAIAAGAPPATRRDELLARVAPGVDAAAWTRLVLELWRR